MNIQIILKYLSNGCMVMGREILKMKMPFRQNWLNYNLHCYKTGLNPGKYKNFKNWVEKRSVY